MANNNHFQIEGSRKVVISIPGYNPVFETQKIEKRFKRIRDKKNRLAIQSAQKQKEAQQAELQTQETALEELNKTPAQAGPVEMSKAIAEENLFDSLTKQLASKVHIYPA